MLQLGNMQEFHSGGSIRNIIFQERQFDCATDNLFGKYNAQNIYNMTLEQINYDIANWAIAGNKLNEVGICLWYLNPFQPTCMQTFPYNGSGAFHTRIYNHCFYRPTDLYDQT